MKAHFFTASSLLSALLLFVTVACTDSLSVDRVLDRADSLSSVKPDSALHLLDSLNDSKTLTTYHRPQTIDSCQQPTANSQRPARPEGALAQPVGARTAAVSRSQKMRLELLRARCMNKADVPFTTDSLLLVVVKHYDRHGTPNEQMEAHYLLGCVYRDIGEVPHAVDCYLDAVAKADTTAEDCNYRVLSSVFSQMAYLYHGQLLLSEEIAAHSQAKRYAEKAGNVIMAIYEMKQSAGAYILLNEKDKAEATLLNAMALYEQNGCSQKAIQSSTLLMHLYADRPERQAELKSLIDKYDAECSLFDEHHELPPNKRLFYYYKGCYFETAMQLDSAEHYYRKIHYPGITLTTQNSMYKGLLGVFSKRRQSDSIAKYATLYCAVNDSSIVKKDRESTMRMASAYNYHRYQKEAYDNEAKASRLRLWLLGIVSSVVIISIILFSWWRRNKKELAERYNKLLAKWRSEMELLRVSKRHVENESDARGKVIAIIKEEMERTKREMQSNQEKYLQLQLSMDEINSEKTELADRIKLLEKQLEDASRRNNALEQIEQSVAFAETDAVMKVKEAIGKQTMKFSNEEMEQLIKTTGLYYPKLIQDLGNIANMNVKKTCVCILTAINLRPGDIARIIDISPSTVSNCKTEINSALFHEKSASSLQENLFSLYSIYSCF